MDLTGRPGPFILTACVDVDGAVWAVLTDAAGWTMQTRQIRPGDWAAADDDGPADAFA